MRNSRKSGPFSIALVPKHADRILTPGLNTKTHDQKSGENSGRWTDAQKDRHVDG